MSRRGVIVLSLIQALALLCLFACEDDSSPSGNGTGPRIVRVPEDFATISQAMAAAKLGDTVQVAAGSYDDTTTQSIGTGSVELCVALKSGVILEGAGASSTVIGSSGASITILADGLSETATIRGLTIRMDAVTKAQGPRWGIFATNGALVDVRDCQVEYAAGARLGLGVLFTEGAVGTIEGTVITNTAVGVLVENASQLQLRGCELTDNEQGAIVESQGSRLSVHDCLLARNDEAVSFDGTGSCGLVERSRFIDNQIGIHANTNDILVLHDTLIGSGEAVISRGPDASVQVVNSILWDNLVHAQIFGAELTIDSSCVQGGYAGSGNIDMDPLFVDVDSGDLTLQSESPCIDMGSAAVLWECSQTSLVLSEFVGEGPDMGAFERVAQ